MEIILTQKALDVLKEIEIYYINQQAQKFYLDLLSKFKRGLELLQDNPYLGHIGVKENTRQLLVYTTDYYIVYRLRNNRIEVLTFLHTSKKYP